jgi:hypothetical protein
MRFPELPAGLYGQTLIINHIDIMKHTIAFVLFMAGCAVLSAQTAPSAFRQITDSLATASPETPVQLPDDYFIKPASDPAGKMQRGTLLYAAAGRARELNNPGRAPVLAAASKIWLQSALPQLGAKPQTASQCHYYLGMIAEQYEGSLAGAQASFQQAIALNPNNARATQALARVQFALGQTAAQ